LSFFLKNIYYIVGIIENDKYSLLQYVIEKYLLSIPIIFMYPSLR